MIERTNSGGENTETLIADSLSQILIWTNISEQEKFPYREFYNETRTRRFIFQDWQDQRQGRRLDVELHARISVGEWAILMSLTTRGEKEELSYVMEVTSIKDTLDGVVGVIYCYDSFKGRREPSVVEYGSALLNDDLLRKKSLAAGIRLESILPESIDFKRTAVTFLEQARRLDFSDPDIFPKNS